MRDVKLRLAKGFAISALAISLTNTIGELLNFHFSGEGTILGPSTLILAITAFIVSLKYRSITISSLLVAIGVSIAIGDVIATKYFTMISFPGPIGGFFFGLGVLALGIIKFVKTKLE